MLTIRFRCGKCEAHIAFEGYDFLAALADAESRGWIITPYVRCHRCPKCAKKEATR